MFNQHVSAKYRRTLYGIMTIGAVFGAFAATNNAPGLQGDAPLAQTTEENVNSGDNDTEEPKLTVPGEFLGGDLDATEGSYFHKQFVAENSTLKNDYSKNQDVKVRITGAGVIGNTSLIHVDACVSTKQIGKIDSEWVPNIIGRSKRCRSDLSGMEYTEKCGLDGFARPWAIPRLPY